MLADGLYQLLSNDAGVKAIVGTPVSRGDKTTGIFKVQVPESADSPAIGFFQVFGASEFTLDGPELFRIVRYQFTCYGQKATDAAGLARAVRRVLEAFTGPLADGSDVDSMECVLEREIFEDAPFVFSAPVDMKIAFRDLGT